MDQEPIKEGFLHKAHPKDRFLSVTVWQKRYFILWGKGTLEYYTNYTMKAEEYCGTLNLTNCQDMVAPIAVGKRHNVIKLSVIKDDKLKDYWLDCDCPPVLNEWVKRLAEASGLTPEENIPESNSTKTLPSIQLRPLPERPEDDSDSPDDDQTGAAYEEIENAPPSDGFGKNTMTRRYTRNSLERQMEAIVANKSLLKREAIQEKPARKVPPPPVSAKPVRVSETTPRPAAIGELKKKLEEKRKSVIEEEMEDNCTSPTEAYEEIQFSTDVVVGTPRHNKAPVDFKKGKMNQDIEPSDYLEFEKKIEIDISPATTPIIPPRDTRHHKEALPPPLPPREHSLSDPNLQSHNRSDKPLPLSPPLPIPPARSRSNHHMTTHNETTSTRFKSSSPLPPLPPRERTNFGIADSDEDTPPPVPRRLQGLSDRPVSFHGNEKRIVPYRTTEIRPMDWTSNDYLQPNDDTRVKNSHSGSPLILIPDTAPITKSPNQTRPPQTKPKPQKPGEYFPRHHEHIQIPSKPTPTSIATETKPPTATRPPAKFPKPKPDNSPRLPDHIPTPPKPTPTVVAMEMSPMSMRPPAKLPKPKPDDSPRLPDRIPTPPKPTPTVVATEMSPMSTRPPAKLPKPKPPPMKPRQHTISPMNSTTRPSNGYIDHQRMNNRPAPPPKPPKI